MFFEYQLTIDANTERGLPATLDAPLCAGVVTRVDIQFPSGCNGLAHASVWRGEHQVWPVNLDGDIAGDDTIVTWPESYSLDDESFSFTLKGWNEDDTYKHCVTFRFTLLSLEEAEEALAESVPVLTLADILAGRM
jgi:hypothetical protein